MRKYLTVDLISSCPLRRHQYFARRTEVHGPHALDRVGESTHDYQPAEARLAHLVVNFAAQRRTA